MPRMCQLGGYQLDQGDLQHMAVREVAHRFCFSCMSSECHNFQAAWGLVILKDQAGNSCLLMTPFKLPCLTTAGLILSKSSSALPSLQAANPQFINGNALKIRHGWMLAACCCLQMLRICKHMRPCKTVDSCKPNVMQISIAFGMGHNCGGSASRFMNA